MDKEYKQENKFKVWIVNSNSIAFYKEVLEVAQFI